MYPSVGYTEKSVFSVERTTNFLGELCDAMCPSLWRNVADGGVQILVLEWDHTFCIQAVHKLCGVVKWVDSGVERVETRIGYRIRIIELYTRRWYS